MTTYQIVILPHGGGESLSFFYCRNRNPPGALRLAIGGGYILGTQKVNTNEWLLVTAVSEENSSIANSTLYINSEVESFSQQLGKTINTQEGPNLNIGSGFKGLLDDVRIYDRALSAVEVKALYKLGEQPVQKSGSWYDLSGQWHGGGWLDHREQDCRSDHHYKSIK